MAEPLPTDEDRERIEDSLVSWWDGKPGCNDKWLKGVFRSAAEFENVDFVVKAHTDEFLRLNQWRFRRLEILVNQVRFDAD